MKKDEAGVLGQDGLWPKTQKPFRKGKAFVEVEDFGHP